MKRKIIFAALAVVMLLSVFAISTSAYVAPQYTQGNTQVDDITYENMQTIASLGVLQNALGLTCKSSKNFLIFHYRSGTKNYIYMLSNVSSYYYQQSYVQVNGSGTSVASFNFSTGFVGASSPASSYNISYGDIIYSSKPYRKSYSDSTLYQGFNEGVIVGSTSYDLSNLVDTWETIYDHLVNYDANIQNATSAGQSYGYQLGMAACQATHSEGTYQDGYDYGYSVGLSDCDKTHQTLKDEAYADGFSYGKAQGAMSGFADCQATHPALLKEAQDVGYAAGDADGYMRGLKEGAENKKEELDLEYWRGRSDGYDYGYTQALESSDAVLDYVDGIFSAPINFLYSAFNIEILGINLFNVIMLFLSLLIVGGVVLLVLKFR